jgi:hypothetical protein
VKICKICGKIIVEGSKCAKMRSKGLVQPLFEGIYTEKQYENQVAPKDIHFLQYKKKVDIFIEKN